MMRKVNELVAYLKKCDDAYYGSGDVLVSNDTYDSLVESLKRMDPTNPYLDKVGFQPNGTNKVGRLIPMGTLDKFHEEDKVKEWLQTNVGIGDDHVLLSPKYDGFGVELTYVNGKLVMASTRGDGVTGEDVTEAMMLVPSVPKELPDPYKSLTCVRGECIIPRANHDAVKALGYKAMRNAVPGIVRSCHKDALHFCDYVAYEFFDGTENREEQRLCYKAIFNIEDYHVFQASDFSKILEMRNHMGEGKDNYIYEMDGVVLKTRAIKSDDYRHPTYQIAWKFKSNRRETILRNIRFDVGATGKISVVGEFDPVEFQGASLTSASIGSVQRYNSMRPVIGCTIEVSRRGDVIPYVEDVISTLEDVPFIEMTTCPCCGSTLVNHICKNPQCKDKVEKKVLQYIKGFGIKGIGVSVVHKLIDGGFIKDLSDIYKMDATIIRTLPRQGDSVVAKWQDLQSKEIPFIKFLSIYPFENLGEAAWKAVLNTVKFDHLWDITAKDLSDLNISGLGVSKCESLISQLQDNEAEIKALINLVHII